MFVIFALAGLFALCFGKIAISRWVRFSGRNARIYGALLLFAAIPLQLLYSAILNPIIRSENDGNVWLMIASKLLPVILIILGLHGVAWVGVKTGILNKQEDPVFTSPKNIWPVFLVFLGLSLIGYGFYLYPFFTTGSLLPPEGPTIRWIGLTLFTGSASIGSIVTLYFLIRSIAARSIKNRNEASHG